MNCCNDIGKCTDGHNCPAHTEFPFAPGVIEGPPRKPMSRADALALLAIMAASSAIMGTVLGYLWSKFA